MKSTANAILSIFLCLCILFGAVGYVSAEIITRGVIPYSEKKQVQDKTDGNGEAGNGKSTADGAFRHIEAAEENTLPDAVKNAANDEATASAEADTSKNAVKTDIDKNAGSKNSSDSLSDAPFGAVNEVNAYSLASKTEENALFDDFDYSGQFYTASDSASYILKTNGRGTVSVKITHDKLTGGAYKVLLYMQYSPNGDNKSYDWRLINELNTTAAGGVFKSPEIGVGGGRLKAVVKCLNSAVPDKEYTVRFLFSARTDCEVEYNDTITRYNEIFAGRTVYGSASYLSDGKDCASTFHLQLFPLPSPSLPSFSPSPNKSLVHP